MKIDITKRPIVEWEVHFNEPIDGTKFQRQVCKCKIKLPTATERLEMLKDIGITGDNYELIKEYVEDWSEVNDVNGDAIPFTKDNLRQLCDFYPSFANGVITAINEATYGKRLEESPGSKKR